MEGAHFDPLFEERRKPAAVKVGNESHIANVSQRAGSPHPGISTGRCVRDALWCDRKS